MEGMEEQERLEDKTQEETVDSGYYSLKNYHGTIVTPENRRELENQFGKEAVLIAQKAEKAWKRGKLSFRYKGQTYPVMTTNYVKYLENYKDMLPQILGLKEEEE